jgi:hypothetical protein
MTRISRNFDEVKKCLRDSGNRIPQVCFIREGVEVTAFSIFSADPGSGLEGQGRFDIFAVPSLLMGS